MNKIPAINPRTGQIDYQVPVFDEADIAQQVVTLRANQPQWLALGITARVEVMAQFAKVLAEHKTVLIDALVQDTGRYHESVLEVDVVISSIERWCQQAPETLKMPAERNGAIEFLRVKQEVVPYSVVGIISPWNFPLLLSFVDAIPALLAGSTILLKPSEITSRFVSVLSLIIEQVPSLSEVLSLVTGGGETGSAVINHSDLICFTGSVQTGRKVAQACANRFIPAFLELGGKDPAIICSDADVEKAAKALAWGSMVNAGQSCMSLERAYVHQDVAREFIDALTANVSKLTHNYPNIEQGQIGPIISQQQVALVKAQLADAIAKGAKVETGGEIIELGGGSYCQPTVLTNVTTDMAIAHQETFAAILPVFIVDSLETAIEQANDSDFGLSAAVFSENIALAQQLASKLEAGAISINDASLTALVHDIEKQSFKLSGLGGSRMGAESIFRFVRKKALIRNVGVTDPWWF